MKILEKLNTARGAVGDHETKMPNYHKSGVCDDLDEVIALVDRGTVFDDPNDDVLIRYSGKVSGVRLPGPCLVIPLPPEVEVTDAHMAQARAVLGVVDEQYGGGKFNWTTDVTHRAAHKLATLEREAE